MSLQNHKRRGQNRAGQEVLGSGQRTNRPRSGNSERRGMLNTESNMILKIQSTDRQATQETKVVRHPKKD